MVVQVEQARFAKPPVKTVVLTVFFEPVRTLQVSHLASLRQLWRAEYPNVAELPPLRPLNRGGDEADLIPVDSAWPFPYVMFTSPNDQQMIAIQNDRLVRSWGFDEDGGSYPGFEALVSDLRVRLDELRQIVREEVGQEIELVASECFYLNELPTIAPEELIVGVATRWHGEVGQAGFPLAHYAGMRIHVDDELRPTLRADVSVDFDADEPSTLGISTRYRVPDGDDGKPELAGIEFAHQKLIELFFEFTSDQMRSEWEQLS